MTFVDALQEVTINDTDQWFRPIGWRGTGQAYCLYKGRICIVPTPRGAVPYLDTDAKALLGEWELVLPEQVNTEC